MQSRAPARAAVARILMRPRPRVLSGGAAEALTTSTSAEAEGEGAGAAAIPRSAQVKRATGQVAVMEAEDEAALLAALAAFNRICSCPPVSSFAFSATPSARSLSCNDSGCGTN